MTIRFRLERTASVPRGTRLYAIGDVHGEGELLCQLLHLIRADNDMRSPAAVKLVFLGDVIDRGPHGIALLRQLARLQSDEVIVLKGNHEAALVDAYNGDLDALQGWLPFGATTTLAALGLTKEEIASPLPSLAAAIRDRVDRSLIDWLECLPSSWQLGGYFFAHAGVRPGVKLSKQSEHDLLWMREPFLSSRRGFGRVVVHGHTVEPGIPALGGNRIGLDTGAHEHGVLTALGLEGEDQWLMQATLKMLVTDWRSKAEANKQPDCPPGMPVELATLIEPIIQSPSAHLRAPRLLDLGSDATLLPSESGPRGGMGTAGLAAVGFALALACCGLGLAAYSRWHHGPPPAAPVPAAVSPIPEQPDAANATLFPVPSQATDSSRPYSGRKLGFHHFHRRPTKPSTRTPMKDAELEQALAEDRAVTRRLNTNELYYQQTTEDR